LVWQPAINAHLCCNANPARMRLELGFEIQVGTKQSGFAAAMKVQMDLH
jgi:hypothetical protein